MSVYDAPKINGIATGVNAPSASERSLGDLFGDLTRDMSRLVRQEVRLARAEMTEKATRIGKDAAMVAAGGLCAFFGVMALVAALILGLAAAGLAPWISALVVGIVICVIGGLLAWQGIAALKRVNPVPEQTIETLKEDQTWIRGEL